LLYRARTAVDKELHLFKEAICGRFIPEKQMDGEPM
jgi:hypothetical protein